MVAALDSARAGNPAVVLVGGEAGVGKSRLVEEAAERARDRGTRILTGSCVELGGEGLPLSPIVDALRSLIRLSEADELDRVIGPARQELARLLPELEPAGPERPTAAREEGSARLLELVLGVISRLALDRPLMLVIEDLHWADRSTLDLVALLIRALREVGVVLVVTFRTDEIHRTHPLRPLVTEWERVRSVRRLELQRFTRAETARQLEAILGAPPTAAMLDLLYERSEGNAFLIEEILGAMQAGADADELPTTLRDLLLARAERLSPPTLRLLRIAAAAGRSVPDALLARVADLDDDSLDAALREAIEHHLLVVDETGHGYRFRHELTRDAVYSDALPRERVRIHAAYAEVLSSEPSLAGSAASAAAALALHFSAAHDIPRALGASVEAARLAGPYAPAEALRHLERALELWPGVPDAAERTRTDVVELLRLAGQMAYASGDLERSVALFDEALAELSDDVEPERMAVLLTGQATAMQDLDWRDDAVARLERAAALLPAEPPTVARADVLLALATIRMVDFTPEWRVGAEQALTAALAAGAREQEAAARMLLGAALAYGEDAEAGIAELRMGLEIAEAISDHATALRGYLNLSDGLEAVGDHEEAAAAATSGLELAKRVGLTRHVYVAYLVSNCAEPMVVLGRWAEAEQLLTDALASSPSGLAMVSAMATMRARIAALAGRYEDAARDLQAASKAMRSSESTQWFQPYWFAQALVAHMCGDPVAARAAIEKGLESDVEMSRYRWPLLWLGLRIEAEVAQPEPARTASLRSAAEALAATTRSEQAYRALAKAEAARVAGTAPDWSLAVESARRSGDAYLTAYALLRGAEDACAAADRDRATAMLEQSAELSARMGAAPLLSEAQALARRARLRLPEIGDGEAVPEGASMRSLESFGLTDREREVLELVAAGRSNPQIAAELFISPKTASVHVSNIISKLGVSSRGEAAALAHRLGLDATAALDAP